MVFPHKNKTFTEKYHSIPNSARTIIHCTSLLNQTKAAMDNTPLEDFLKGNDEREQIQEILKQNKLFTIGDVLKDNVNINNVNIEERIRGEYKW